MTLFRKLIKEEIESLVHQGCSAESWDDIDVSQDFTPDAIKFVEFSGHIRLGVYIEKGAGICSASLKNVTVGDDVCIKRIGRILENCDIHEKAIIENVAEIAGSGAGNFGIGGSASVLVEAGGREVHLHPRLSAQVAYLEAFASLAEFKMNFNSITLKEIVETLPQRLIIGKAAKIRDCGRIVDSLIGESAEVCGASEIINSTINGHVGSQAFVKDSVVASGGYIGVGCQVEKCFVGEAAVLDYGFSAENSLFFANTECLRGEACSVFAAPFTSSHHKSTLLLAAIYSFYTAGSGSNFSNHRFKLGPLHQGVLERGTKSGSSSYLIWPSKTAPFTTIIGRHLKKVDTSLFPFSLLVEQQGESVLLPGALMFSCGFERDSAKWLHRDKRSSDAVDIVNSLALTPFTISKVLQAIDILKAYKNGEEIVGIEGVDIPVEYVDKALARYHAGVNIYYGGVVANILEEHYSNGKRIIDHCIDDECAGEWVDVAGLLAPVREVEKIIQNVADKKIVAYAGLLAAFENLEKLYYDYEWKWLLATFGKINFVSDKQSLVDILTNWQKAAELRLRLVMKDAVKEYAAEIKIGYGALGEQDDDFTAVRGMLEDNSFVQEVQRQTDNIISRAELLMIRVMS